MKLSVFKLGCCSHAIVCVKALAKFMRKYAVRMLARRRLIHRWILAWVKRNYMIDDPSLKEEPASVSPIEWIRTVCSVRGAQLISVNLFVQAIELIIAANARIYGLIFTFHEYLLRYTETFVENDPFLKEKQRQLRFIQAIEERQEEFK